MTQRAIQFEPDDKIGGIPLKHKPELLPSYGDLLTLEEWEEATVKSNMITEHDGFGEWATESHTSNVSCWHPRPEWATHVMWYNK